MLVLHEVTATGSRQGSTHSSPCRLSPCLSLLFVDVRQSVASGSHLLLSPATMERPPETVHGNKLFLSEVASDRIF